MRLRFVSPAVALVLAPALVAPSTGGAAPPAAARQNPVLVDVRGAHRDGVDRVVLRDASGSTLDPDGPGDSTPACLEP